MAGFGAGLFLDQMLRSFEDVAASYMLRRVNSDGQGCRAWRYSIAQIDD